MRKYTYRGDACRLGHFGNVEPGDVLTLNLLESRNVENNERFEPCDDGMDGRPAVPLQAVRGTDLRRIRWDAKDLASYLRIKFKKRGRNNIARAMKAIGCDIEITRYHNARQVADIISTEAVRNGWHRLSSGERRLLPALGIPSDKDAPDNQSDDDSVEDADGAGDADESDDDGDEASTDDGTGNATVEGSVAGAHVRGRHKKKGPARMR